MTDPFGPCDTWSPPANWCCTVTGSMATVSGAALATATEILFQKSGQQFGLCTQTLRPCRADCEGTYGWINPAVPGGWTYPQPALIDGRWYNLVCGSCGDNCSCSFLSEALLPAPVHAVTTVKVDGVTLTQGVDYRLDESRRLVRLGSNFWPWCNDLKLADTQVGTWSVTAQFGTPVPAAGSLAVGELACEIAKLMLCDTACRLSPYVRSIDRQGISMELVTDPDNVLSSLYAVSLFLQAYNPDNLRGRARAYSLDSPTFRLTG